MRQLLSREYPAEDFASRFAAIRAGIDPVTIFQERTVPYYSASQERYFALLIPADKAELDQAAVQRR